MRGWTLLLAGYLALSACAGSTPPAEAFDPFHVAGVDRKPGAGLPMDLQFRDETGRSVSLRQIGRGRPIVLAPVQHRCPNICGFTLSGLAEAVAAQQYRPGRDFEIVAFGIDPKEAPSDAKISAERLRDKLAVVGGEGVHALVGRSADVSVAMRALGYRYGWDARIGQYAHIAAVAVLTPDGRPARWLYGIQPQGNDLRLALTEAGRGRIGDLGDQLLLLCFHYDPHTGRYSGLVWTLLRVGAGLTLLALGGFIGLAVLRDRRLKARSRTP
jgi:protein SCO1/2